MGAGVLGHLGRNREFWQQRLATAVPVEARETFQEVLVLTRRNKASAWQRAGASLVPVRKRMGMGPTSIELLVKIELKSLILAQIERWRHALHMQVERQRGGNPGGERRTGE